MLDGVGREGGRNFTEHSSCSAEPVYLKARSVKSDSSGDFAFRRECVSVTGDM